MNRTIKRIGKVGIRIIMIALRVLPINRKKIVFSSFSARSYSDNPRAILEKILEGENTYDCVVVLNDVDGVKLPNGVRVVKHNSLKYLYEMATAKVWIDNTRKQPHILKRRNQIYIQTWHGAIFLKKIEKDVESTLDKEYIYTAKNDSKNIDVLLTNSKWEEDRMTECFWYSGKMVRTGSPRLDVLFKSEFDVKQIQEYMRLKSGTDYVLYAPTFRKNNNDVIFDIDLKRLIDALEEKNGKKWGVIVRLHPNIANSYNNIIYSEKIINGNLISDITEIFPVVKMLITDYSSAIFDFCITRKPAIIYAPDYEEYKKERDYHFELNKLPFPIAENNTQLSNIINNFDYEFYNEELDAFLSDLDVKEDGHASERVVALINEMVK